jgi:hypothetical protein
MEEKSCEDSAGEKSDDKIHSNGKAKKDFFIQELLLKTVPGTTAFKHAQHDNQCAVPFYKNSFADNSARGLSSRRPNSSHWADNLLAKDFALVSFCANSPLCMFTACAE